MLQLIYFEKLTGGQKNAPCPFCIVVGSSVFA